MILFSGKHLVAHWNEGGSDFLLVSFNQLNSEHAATEHFLLQPQVQAENISCIGVMTREKNFYITPEMDHIVALVAEKRRGRKLIIFGQSMGGYAALKFSGRLQADFVIATSPFFSVRADELELDDPRQRRILVHTMAKHDVPDRPEFAGMAIRSNDVHGRIVVLFDPAEMVDAFAVNLIAKYLPQAEFFTVPHSGHVIYDASWSSTLIAELFKAVRSTDRALMGRTVIGLRRNQVAFLTRTLAKAANRKPRLFVGAINSRRIRSHPHYRDLIGDPFNLRAIVLLTERGEYSRAAIHLATVTQACYGFDIRPATREPGTGLSEVMSQHRCLIISNHGSFLCWNVEGNVPRFEPHPFRLATRLPIVVSVKDGAIRFSTVSNGVETPVPLFAHLPDGTLEPSDRIELIDHCLIAIHNGGRYLGALPDGGLQILPAITHQQRLTVLPLRDQSKLFEIQRTNWFDQVAESLPTPATAGAQGPVQRRAQRWRRLFARG